MPHSGWPFARHEIEPYFKRALSLVEAGPFVYDRGEALDALARRAAQARRRRRLHELVPVQPHARLRPADPISAHRYGEDLKRIPRLTPYFHANVTGLRLAPDAASLDHLDVATLSGKHFTVRPKITVLATGAMENARLLLASNDVAAQGIGNANDHRRPLLRRSRDPAR